MYVCFCVASSAEFGVQGHDALLHPCMGQDFEDFRDARPARLMPTLNNKSVLTESTVRNFSLYLIRQNFLGLA